MMIVKVLRDRRGLLVCCRPLQIIPEDARACDILFMISSWRHLTQYPIRFCRRL